MSRNIVTGGYQIDSPTFTGIVPKEQIGGLVNVDSDGLLWQSTVTLYGTAALMLLLFGYGISRSLRKGERHTAQA
ncbi:hypothetical protein [Comamonas testosteroni]|uniref:hypothetical protein n=1 Tax=Comamonas testosteroni TaxID=285 RepID=UPI00265F30C8|nr:hypothetical protein [Comamonas testosteroni]WKL15914.1 hypothetical protein QYQ99_26995 [Comamonas testosteroni]